MTTWRRFNGYLLAATATAAWALNFVIARWLNDDVAPLMLAFSRWAVAGAVLLFVGLPAVRRDLPLLRRHWRLLLATSATGMLLFNSTIYLGAHTSEAANLALIAAFSPIITLFLARREGGERIGGRQWAGSVIAFVGVVVLVGRGNPLLWQTGHFVVGDVWMLAGAVLWSFYTMFLQRKPAAIGMTAFHAATIWLSLPFLFLFAAAESAVVATAWSWRAATGVVYLGLIASIFCYYCWNGALVRIGSVQASSVYYALPLLAALEAALLLGEPVAAYHLFAMVLIIGGVLVSVRQKRRLPPASACRR